MKRSIAWACAGLALFATVPVLAGPVDLVRSRQASYRQLGAAFKSLNDTLRSGSPSLALIRQSAAGITAGARDQYRLFPVASRPQAGLKTDALAAIWTDPAGFKARQDAFARQAVAFQRASAGTDIAIIRAEARKLGATCKSCHDQFRAEDD